MHTNDKRNLNFFLRYRVEKIINELDIIYTLIGAHST